MKPFFEQIERVAPSVRRRGTYTITGLMPVLEGQRPEYRIKHFSEEFERVAFRQRVAGG
jgi:hypothetical protein